MCACVRERGREGKGERERDHKTAIIQVGHTSQQHVEHGHQSAQYHEA